MKTKIVNRKNASFDISVGRDSKWGNPFHMKNQSQEERNRVCEEFEKYYAKKEMWRNIWQLKNKTLGCYCKPLRCHGDFLANQANNSFEIHSGGAEGSDSLFDKYAPENAVIVHHSFDNHKISKGLRGTRVIHSNEELRENFKMYENACRNLGRYIAKNSYVQNLCLRNYFQVSNANFVVAIVEKITNFNKCICEGGTGYAIDYARQLGKPMLIYNQADCFWYFSQNGEGLRVSKSQNPNWEMIRYTNIAGIGTRNINSNGENAIKCFLQNNSCDVAPKRYTPYAINSLKEGEIFVFGSNLQGIHGKGAALTARKFGAKIGVGEGLQGQTYALPTKRTPYEPLTQLEVAMYIGEFIEFAKSKPHLTFLVTKVGCGNAGFTEEQIKPMFADAHNYSNIILPEKW